MAELSDPLPSKFRGALLGTAVGDALGAPFEGAGYVESPQLRELLRDPGPLRYTDDTHMTTGMAHSLIEQQGFDGAQMAETFMRNFNDEPWRGYGAGPPQVFALIQQGVAWDEAGRRLFGGSGSFGNGAAMRVAPAALFAFADLDHVDRLARQSALITHAHELGADGAALQACAVALLLQRSPQQNLDRQSFVGELRQRMRTDMFREALDRVVALLPASPREKIVAELGRGIEAVHSVPTALYLFLRRPESFADAVLDAVGLGGDADTIAAMTGALSGAYLGEAGIPAMWRENVEGAEELQRLADGLFELAVRRESGD